jgi:lysophospholipase L1-like esterase
VRRAAIALVAALGMALAVVLPRTLSEEPAASRREGRGSAPWPRSMAAIGDSITRAINVSHDAFDTGTRHSWATGTDLADGVLSHYERIRDAQPAISGAVHNLSVPGARVRDAPLQARLAVAQSVEYVTVLIGANDACASTPLGMTPVRSFRRSFTRALDTLARGLPEAIIYVMSIPDVSRLWNVLSNDPRARAAWRSSRTCPVALSERTGARDRRLVRERIERFNAALEAVCGRQPRCHHDGGAVFSYRFAPEDVSAVDFFHPSLHGQRKLAEVTWRHGPLATASAGRP